MKSLKCNAKSCVYNKNTTCEKERILIGDGDDNNNEIKCESYSPLGGTRLSYEMAEEASVANHTNNEQPSIDCLADCCKYNDKHKCVASSVEIEDYSMDNYGQTVCETYEKR